MFSAFVFTSRYWALLLSVEFFYLHSTNSDQMSDVRLVPRGNSTSNMILEFDFLVHEHETEAISKMKVSSKENLKFFVYIIYQWHNKYFFRCIINPELWSCVKLLWNYKFEVLSKRLWKPRRINIWLTINVTGSVMWGC